MNGRLAKIGNCQVRNWLRFYAAELTEMHDKEFTSRLRTLKAM